MDDIGAKFDRYLELKAQQAAIKAELETLSTSLLLLFDPEAPTVPWGDKVFRRCERTSWTYSENVKAIEKDLKQAKKREEQDGTAQPSTTVFIRVEAGKGGSDE